VTVGVIDEQGGHESTLTAGVAVTAGRGGGEGVTVGRGVGVLVAVGVIDEQEGHESTLTTGVLVTVGGMILFAVGVSKRF
jgi:hypothetical protein